MNVCVCVFVCLGITLERLTSIKLGTHNNNNNKTPWPQSASEQYQPSDRRLSTKLVPTFRG
jgi:hypothetical protein